MGNQQRQLIYYGIVQFKVPINSLQAISGTILRVYLTQTTVS